MIFFSQITWHGFRFFAAANALAIGLVSPALATIVDFAGNAEFLTHQQMQDFASGCANCAGKFYTNKITPGHEHDSRYSYLLQWFHEQQDVEVTSAIGPIATNNPPYQQALPGPGVGWEHLGAPIPVGAVVDSHFIWLNSWCDGPHGCNMQHNIATFRFDGPIVGIIGNPPQFIASHNSLGWGECGPGEPCVGYAPNQSFYNEGYPNNPQNPPAIPPSGDIVTKLAPNILRVDFTSIAGDYVRVVTNGVPLPAGDFDADYDVDGNDYAVWRSSFGATGILAADANFDRVVDAADYSIWRSSAGSAWSHLAANVPEPGTTILIAAIALLTAPVRIRRRILASS